MRPVVPGAATSPAVPQMVRSTVAPTELGLLIAMSEVRPTVVDPADSHASLVASMQSAAANPVNVPAVTVSDWLPASCASAVDPAVCGGSVSRSGATPSTLSVESSAARSTSPGFASETTTGRPADVAMVACSPEVPPRRNAGPGQSLCSAAGRGSTVSSGAPERHAGPVVTVAVRMRATAARVASAALTARAPTRRTAALSFHARCGVGCSRSSVIVRHFRQVPHRRPSAHAPGGGGSARSEAR